jgi:DNA-binding HxlR family transcriptional regulator
MDIRSGCPINLSIEALGDKWSMVLLRDIMFGDRRTYRDLLINSLEGISTNILGNRLKALVSGGFITADDDPTHKQRTIYSLTQQGIALLPAMVALGAWGRQFLPATPELAARNQVLEEGGQEMLEAFMAELRERHLGIPACGAGRDVSGQLQAAFADAIAQKTEAMSGRSK